MVMKTSSHSEHLKTCLVFGLYVAGTLTAATRLWAAPAQEGNVAATSVVASPATGTEGAVVTTPAAPAARQNKAPEPTTGTLTTGVEAILKMVDAGVSKDVIKTYIESSPTAYNPSATDLIALKEHAVPDDLTTALLKRGAEIRAQVSQVGANAAARTYSNSNPGYAYLDPESYDYFRYYYLYPRTLADVYQRLSPCYPAYSYGYCQPFPFRPYFSVGYAHPRYSGFRRGFSR
jgi:hypothetical protein